MSYKAILVKYLPCTKHKPWRVKALVHRRLSITVSISEYSSSDVAKLEAAKALAENLDWHGKYVKSTLPNGNTVFVKEDSLDTFGSFTL